MKVLKNGFQEHPWSRKLGCKGCKSQLEIDMADVLYEEWNDMGGETNRAYFVRCGVCEKKVFLKADDLPAHVRKAAEARQ